MLFLLFCCVLFSATAQPSVDEATDLQGFAAAEKGLRVQVPPRLASPSEENDSILDSRAPLAPGRTEQQGRAKVSDEQLKSEDNTERKVERAANQGSEPDAPAWWRPPVRTEVDGKHELAMKMFSAWNKLDDERAAANNIRTTISQTVPPEVLAKWAQMSRDNLAKMEGEVKAEGEDGPASDGATFEETIEEDKRARRERKALVERNNAHWAKVDADEAAGKTREIQVFTKDPRREVIWSVSEEKLDVKRAKSEVRKLGARIKLQEKARSELSKNGHVSPATRKQLGWDRVEERLESIFTTDFSAFSVESLRNQCTTRSCPIEPRLRRVVQAAGKGWKKADWEREYHTQDALMTPSDAEARVSALIMEAESIFMECYSVASGKLATHYTQGDGSNFLPSLACPRARVAKLYNITGVLATVRIGPEALRKAYILYQSDVAVSQEFRSLLRQCVFYSADATVEDLKVLFGACGEDESCKTVFRKHVNEFHHLAKSFAPFQPFTDPPEVSWALQPFIGRRCRGNRTSPLAMCSAELNDQWTKSQDLAFVMQAVSVERTPMAERFFQDVMNATRAASLTPFSSRFNAGDLNMVRMSVVDAFFCLNF